MRRSFVLLILLALLSFCVSTLVSARDDESLFTLASADPIVSPAGLPGEWDGQYTDPGAVLFHDGQFHMFRNGFNGWPAPVQIGYLTSNDGVAWTEVTEDPVFTTDEVPYADVAALASSALVEDDGTGSEIWVLYFYTWDAFSGTNAPGAIGRATAAQPTGPWTPDPAPVLQPGPESSWDDQQVSTPRVRHTNDGYVMYYTGYNQTGFRSAAIGMATSPDGITWTKHDDPATTDAPFADSDPILVSPSDAEWIHQPMVVPNGDGWGMIYRAANGTPTGMKLYCTTSDDGVTWTPAAEPFWAYDSIPGARGFWFTALAYANDAYHLFIEGGVGGGTHIFAATHDGPLAC